MQNAGDFHAGRNPRLEITVLLLDLSRWIAVRQLLGWNNSEVYGGKWLATARCRLLERINREG